MAFFYSDELAQLEGRASLICSSHSGRCLPHHSGRSAPAHPSHLFTPQLLILPILTVCLSHKRSVVSAKHVAPLSITPGVHHSISEILQAEKGNLACHSVGTVPSVLVSRVLLSSCRFTLPVPSLAANGQSGHFMQVNPLWQEIISRQHDVLLQGGFSQSRNEGHPGKRQELRGRLRNRTGKAC